MKRDMVRGSFGLPRRLLFFWVLVLLSAATLGLGLWTLQREKTTFPAQAVKVNQELAPEFHLQAIDGTTVSLGNLRGKVVLLNFWATWCPPCKAEMPDLEALFDQYGTPHDFVVVGVNLQEDQDTVQQYATQARVSFPLLLDPSGTVSGRWYAVRTLPMSLLIDREGYIRDAWTGRIPRADMLARLEQVW